MTGGTVKRKGPGPPKHRPHHLAGDKVYSIVRFDSMYGAMAFGAPFLVNPMNAGPDRPTGPATTNGTR
jgi:hypothetical protein